jgi:hypothetical protein
MKKYIKLNLLIHFSNSCTSLTVFVMLIRSRNDESSDDIDDNDDGNEDVDDKDDDSDGDKVRQKRDWLGTGQLGFDSRRQQRPCSSPLYLRSSQPPV